MLDASQSFPQRLVGNGNCSLGEYRNQPPDSLSLRDIHQRCTDSSKQTAFLVTAMLRNATGHDLVRDDIFDDPRRYCDLFQQELNALFYVISLLTT